VAELETSNQRLKFELLSIQSKLQEMEAELPPKRENTEKTSSGQDKISGLNSKSPNAMLKTSGLDGRRSASRHGKLKPVDKKAIDYIQISEKSIQSMELYRVELLKKEEQLQNAEKEIQRLHSIISSLEPSSLDGQRYSFSQYLIFAN
jgi:hypothetical protein